MQRETKEKAKDSQVFLVMGVAEDDDDSHVAIVIADGVDRARAVFEKTFRGATAMTYPSLAEIKLSVAWMDDARNGGFVAPVIVINDMT
jgi:hypothetical protein